MKSPRGQIWLPYLLALCAHADAQAPTMPSTSAARTQIEALAGENLDAVRFFRVYFWQPLDEEALVVWLGREEPYLITLRKHCQGLLEESQLPLTEYQRPGRNVLRARWSQVLTEDGNLCRIGSIRALDLDRLRALGPPYTPAPVVDTPAAPDGRRWDALKPIDSPLPADFGSRRSDAKLRLSAEVGDSGRVRQVRIDASSGRQEFDQSVQDAVRRWRFEPYRQGQIARPVWVQLDLRPPAKE